MRAQVKRPAAAAPLVGKVTVCENPETAMPSATLTAATPRTTPRAAAELSVIIPAFNEETRIETAIASAWNAGAGEVVVVDGGSTDGTRERAASGARVVLAPRGRASQMNAGARAASGETLLFLHADARLPAGAAAAVRAALADPGVGGGAFRMRIDDGRAWYRIVTALAQARAALCGITLGDQAIFVRREAFAAAGGFRPIPILEDLDLVERLRRRARFRILRPEVVSSPRRWESRGRWRTSLANLLILLLYRAGARPETLAGLYQ